MSLDPKKAQEYEKATQGAAKNVKSVADKSKDLEKNLREVLFLTRDYASEARNATKAIFESSEQASAAATAFKKVANVTRDIGTEMDDVLSGALSFEQASKKINQYEQARKSLMTEQKQALDKCGHRYSSCLLRFNEKLGKVPFGGFLNARLQM